jgi:hypothetical protein
MRSSARGTRKSQFWARFFAVREIRDCRILVKLRWLVSAPTHGSALLRRSPFAATAGARASSGDFVVAQVGGHGERA